MLFVSVIWRLWQINKYITSHHLWYLSFICAKIKNCAIELLSYWEHSKMYSSHLNFKEGFKMCSNSLNLVVNTVQHLFSLLRNYRKESGACCRWLLREDSYSMAFDPDCEGLLETRTWEAGKYCTLCIILLLYIRCIYFYEFDYDRILIRSKQQNFLRCRYG
jgi:hypothetical protein